MGPTGSRFAKDQWTLVDPHDKSSNVRLWPYAAMDYYIQLLQAPDVTDLTEDKILQEYTRPCKPPGTNIMQFFGTEMFSFRLCCYWKGRLQR